MRPFAVSTAEACYCSYVDGELCWPVVGRLYTGDVGTAVVDARQPRLPAIRATGVTARRLTSASVNHTVTAASVSVVIRGAGSTQTYNCPSTGASPGQICGVDRHGERGARVYNGGLEADRPPSPSLCKNSSDLYQFQERPLAKVGWTCPPQSTPWRSPCPSTVTASD